MIRSDVAALSAPDANPHIYTREAEVERLTEAIRKAEAELDDPAGLVQRPAVLMQPLPHALPLRHILQHWRAASAAVAAGQDPAGAGPGAVISNTARAALAQFKSRHP